MIALLLATPASAARAFFFCQGELFIREPTILYVTSSLNAELRSRRISLRLRVWAENTYSDSGLKISTPTPTLASLQSRLNKSHFMLRKATSRSHFLISILIASLNGDTAIKYRFALAAVAAGRSYRGFL